MPKDKAGNYLTFKEYLQRWKRGIEGITPLQQTNIQIRGTFIIILGLLSGIFICSLNIKNLWWLMIILIGGLFNTAVQMLGLWQKKQVLLRFEKPKEIVGDKRLLIRKDVERIIKKHKDMVVNDGKEKVGMGEVI